MSSRALSYSLSGQDIDRALNANSVPHRILTYKEVAQYPSWTQLVATGPCVVIFETRPQYGHWVCCWQNSEGMQFFDSYGIEVDGEQEWNFDPTFKRQQLEDYPYLLQLMYTHSLHTGVPIIYNQYPLQEHNPKIRTCGRHVIVRLCMGFLSCDEYKKALDRALSKQCPNYDKLVTALTLEYQ